MFIVGRLIIGLGLASFLMTSLVVVQEITHPHSRESVAQSWDSYWILGSVFASWVNFGTSYLTGSWSWVSPKPKAFVTEMVADPSANPLPDPAADGHLLPRRCAIRA